MQYTRKIRIITIKIIKLCVKFKLKTFYNQYLFIENHQKKILIK